MKKSFGENLNATGDAIIEPQPQVVAPAPAQAKETLVKQITTHTTALIAGIALGFIIAKYFSK